MIPDTIRTLFAAGDLDGILHQVEILMDDRNRVRAENDGYKHEIRRLAIAFANITEPHTGRLVSEPRPTPVRTTEAPLRAQPKSPVRTMNEPKPKPTKETLDLDL